MITRISHRVPVSTPVDIRLESGTYTGYLRNISVTGAYLHSTEELIPGSAIQLKFVLPGDDKVFGPRGVVKWSTRPGGGKDYFGGSGVMFTSLSPEEERALKQFVNAEAKRLCLDC